MTTIGVTHDRSRSTVGEVRGGTVRRVLIACGFLSTALYIAADVIGGLRYDGYSFYSQAISELVAIGAPSRSFVEPLFITYDVLALAFAVGVLWEAASRNRTARLTAGLLLGFVLFSWIGFATSPAHERGTATLAADLRHVVVAVGVIFLLVLTIGVGAFTLGRRFRLYSFATILLMLASSALTFPQAGRIAANQPTPGVGILERIDVYAPMIWLAVLAIILLRRPETFGRRASLETQTGRID